MELRYGKDVMESEEYRSWGGEFHGSPWDISWADEPYRERKMKTLAPDILEERLRQVLESGTPSGRGAVYIHIPFCRLACTYCGFYKEKTDAEKQALYTDSLVKEIRSLADFPYVRKSQTGAVFFGGGTPGLLTPSQISRIMEAVKDTFHLLPEAEVTMESSLSDMTEEKMRAAIESGINRFSFGVQSFDTRVRRSVGRGDSREAVAEKLAGLAKEKAGMVIDLIYGLPYQTEEVMAGDIRRALSLGISGLDLYKLQIHPSSPLGKQFKAQGKVQEVAQLQSLFRIAQNGLTHGKAVPISCTHWKMKPGERSLYNAMAAGESDIFALGMACGGKLGEISFFKPVNAAMYHAAAGKRYVAMGGQVKGPYRKERGVLSSACDRGIFDLDMIGHETGAEVSGFLMPIFKSWTNWGLLTQQGSVFSMTEAGRFWYKTMMRFLLRMFENGLYGFPGEEERKHIHWQGMKNMK